jgi:predicted MFS family arabinose efflux permease
VIILRLAAALFLVQAGFHAYTASMPLALARAGTPDAAIGLVMGVSALVQIPAAIAGGRLLDAFGGPRLFMAGGLAYLAATGILLLPGVQPGGSLAPFVAARILQGVGIGLTLPSALTMVPRLVPPARTNSGLAYVSAAQNLTLVVLPPLSIAVLDATSLDGVAAMVVAFVLAGLVLGAAMPVRERPTQRDHALGEAQRRYGITFRREWTMPLLIIITYVAHWGAVTAYLPVRAEASGANVGLYFAADGVGIFLMRLPTGRLVERFTPRALVLAGGGMTAVAIGMLLLPLTTPLLLVSGLLGGTGGALVMTPLTVELSRRSSDADRGSAFALFSGSLAGAIALGSIGGAPVVALFGLSAALVAGIVLIGVSMALTASDRLLAEPVVAGAAAAVREPEPESA